MSRTGALARLALARARRRPAGWLLSVLGIAVVLAYAAAVVVSATIAADRTARVGLSSVPAVQRGVRLTWQGVVTPGVRREADAVLRRLGLTRSVQVVLMNPVRLTNVGDQSLRLRRAVVVRPAAITPLSAYTAGGGATRPCTPQDCPVLLAAPSSPDLRGGELTAPSIRLTIVGTATLGSPLPLGFLPGAAGRAAPPVVLTGDARGLDGLGGLDAIYRTDSWVAPLDVARLHAWQLGALGARLRRTQAQLLASNSGFNMTAPFSALDSARAAADAAPHRLWLAGGGAAAALVMFVVLVAGSWRRDQARELERLVNAGARSRELVGFAILEAAILCTAAVLTGAIAGLGAGALVARLADPRTSAATLLHHSLFTPGWVAVLAGVWLLGTALLVAVAARPAGRPGARPSGRILDALALAAAAALALGLVVVGGSGGGGGGAGGNDPLAVLVAPLCALAAGVLVFRLASAILRSAERVARRGPILVRLALVGLARAPVAPALAVAFLAVSVGLGGFALAYRATLLRGAADEAADRVPLDGLIAAGPSFTRPLDVASLARWHTLVGGRVWPVRRAEATYVDGGASVTVPALGVPAAALPRIHGWRRSDGPASLSILARRLTRAGPLRTPGPQIVGPRVVTVPVDSPSIALAVTAVLRRPDGTWRRIALGTAGAGAAPLRARIPAGHWELNGFELQESAGLEATNGHQNAENAAAATQFTATVRLGPISVAGGRVDRWRGVGALSVVSRLASGGTVLHFSSSAESGFIRPPQPSDTRPLPVLSSTALPHVHELPLSIDGLPITAEVVGTLRRFPTAGQNGFVVADEAALASALDAQRPGEGASDELWQLGGHGGQPFPTLTESWRADVARTLRTAPVARAIVGTMTAASLLAGLLAIGGLLVALLGSMRDRRAESDLIAQGLSPRQLRRELRLQIAIAAVLGTISGLVISVLLTALALAAVRTGLGLAVPQPPLVMVAPWPALAVLAVGALAAAALAGVLGSRPSGRVR